MAASSKKNTSDKIIEDILNESSHPEFSLICETKLDNEGVVVVEQVGENTVSLPSLMEERDDSHGQGMDVISLVPVTASSGEVSQSSLAPVGDQITTEDAVGITGFETVVGDMEVSSDHVTLDPQSALTVIEELNYTDSNGVLIPKFVGEETEEMALTTEVKGEVSTSNVETPLTAEIVVQPETKPVQVGTLVGVTDIGGNIVTIGGQHFILFTGVTSGTDVQATATQVLVQQPGATGGGDEHQPPAMKRLRTGDNTLTSPLTEEGVENLVGFDAAHPNIQVEVIEEEQVGETEKAEPGEEAESRTDITQNWFTTKDDKHRLKLQHKGSTWKQGQWSKDEVDLLKTNIERYCKLNNIGDPSEIIFDMTKDERKNFYRIIAVGLNRPLFSVYRRVIRMYDQKNHLGKYTPAEVEKLKDLREQLGSDWAAIGAKLGRSASSVKDRCRLMKERCYSGKWLPEEEKLLTDAVYRLSGAMPGMDVTVGLSWAAVSERVGSRTEKQCRTKWLNYLNWKNRGGTDWTRGDDISLIEKVCNMNVSEEAHINWEHLSKGWSSVRSPQWLRGKWWSLKRHVIQDNHNMSFKDILDQLRSDMNEMSRPYSVATNTRSNMPFAVKIEKPHAAVSHTQTVATSPSCYDVPATHTVIAADGGGSSQPVVCEISSKHSVISGVETSALIQTHTQPVATGCATESLIVYSNEDVTEPQGQQVLLVYPDQQSISLEPQQQTDLKTQNPMMSSAVGD